MTSLLALLVACGRDPKPVAPAPGGAWIREVGTWYCASEPLPAKTPGEPPGTRDIVVKLTPGEVSLLGLYAVREGARTYIGTLTRFSETGERAATFEAQSSQRQSGSATATFAPDASTLTLGWQVGSQPAPSTTILTAAADPAACAAGALLK